MKQIYAYYNPLQSKYTFDLKIFANIFCLISSFRKCNYIVDYRYFMVLDVTNYNFSNTTFIVQCTKQVFSVGVNIYFDWIIFKIFIVFHFVENHLLKKAGANPGKVSEIFSICIIIVY